MSDDDWETFEGKTVNAVAPQTTTAVAAAVVKPTAADDEEEKEVVVELTAAELKEQLAKLQREFDSYRKGVEAQKVSKNENKKDKQDLEKLLSEQERKEREKALIESSDLANALELFGVTSAPSQVTSATTSSGTPVAAKAAPKDELAHFVKLATAKLKTFSKSPGYLTQVDGLVRTLVEPFKGAQLKELGEQLVSVSKTKLAAEKEAEKKAKVKTQQNKLSKASSNVLSDAMADYEDYAAAEDDQNYDDDDDFM